MSCLDGGIDDDTIIHLWDYLGGYPDQEWAIIEVVHFVDVDAGHIIAKISPYMTGVCLEDVNHEVYGGIDSQMIFGESFQEPPPYDPNVLYKIINKRGRPRTVDADAGSANGSRAIVWQVFDAPTSSGVSSTSATASASSSIITAARHSRRSTADLERHAHSPLGLPEESSDQHWTIGAGVGFVEIRNRSGRRLLSCKGADKGTHDGGRPHASLGPGVPDPLPACLAQFVSGYQIRAGHRVVVEPVLGGLHHEYSLEPIAA